MIPMSVGMVMRTCSWRVGRSFRRSAARRGDLPGVVAHDLADLVVGEAGDVLHECSRFRESFGMGPVGTEEEMVDADEVLEQRDVVFVERCDPDVLAECLHRIP